MNPIETNVPCNLCGADDARVLYQRMGAVAQDVDFGSHMTTNIYGSFGRVVRCQRCGLVYRNPRVDDTRVMSAYQAMEDPDYLSEQECRGMNGYLCLRVIKRFKTEGRLLDVGCATGFFLNAARADFDVHGIEPSAWAAGFAQKKLGLDVVSKGLAQAPYPEGHFDVLSMIDVIEHFSNPAGEIEHVARLLKPGGLFYIVTPDINSFSARLLGRYWWGLRPSHLFYFSQSTLIQMLNKAGFDVVHTRSYGRIFTYGYWLSRLKEYPSFIYNAVRWVVEGLNLSEKVLYLDTRDTMEICAIRRVKESSSCVPDPG